MTNKKNNNFVNQINIVFCSIPNFWFTYYLYGFYRLKNASVSIKIETEFEEFNFTNRSVIRIYFGKNCKLIVIDLDDPCERHFSYFDKFDKIFLSQKLVDRVYTNDKKHIPLLPHFPIRSFQFLKLVSRLILRKKYFFSILKEIVRVNRLKPVSILNKRYFQEEPITKRNFIFYHRSLWKKEDETNLLGAIFLDCAKKNRFETIGGLSRSDEFKSNNPLIEKYIIKKRISNTKYVSLTRQSEFVFNSPSIRGACSWRFGEYIALNKVILNTPFKVHIPKEIKCITFEYTSVNDFEFKLDKFFSEIEQFDKNQYSNKRFFFEKMYPDKQVERIILKTFEDA